MADLLGTDEFLVNRNDVTYTQQQETLMATLQDTDHLLINRAGQTYKITGGDLINSVVDPLEVTVILTPTEGYTDTEVTAVPVVSGGKQPDGGYIFTYQWVTADDAAGTNKTNIAGETGSTFTPDNTLVGKYLGCVVSTTDAFNTFAEGEAYIGPIQILAQAPVISDVTISEIYDGANRYTDKEFPYVTTMAINGEPAPTYEIKTKLSGTTFDFDVVTDTITDVGEVVIVPVDSYEVSRSLRFNPADTSYLSRTLASAGNRKTWTLSWWMKLGNLNDGRGLFGMPGSSSGSPQFYSQIGSDNKLYVYDYKPGGSGYHLLKKPDYLFEDPSAWYHCVFQFDSTQSNAEDGFKIYVNGTRLTTWTTNNLAGYQQNYDGAWNSIDNTGVHMIGQSDSIFDGYLADVHFIDGQALDPTSFGEFNAKNVWKPKGYTGTYGTNGFHLDFSDNSSTAALGTDTSGNGNDWTVNNITLTGIDYAQLSNWSTGNSVVQDPQNAFDGSTLTEATCNYTGQISQDWLQWSYSFTATTSLRFYVAGGPMMQSISINGLSAVVPGGNGRWLNLSEVYPGGSPTFPFAFTSIRVRPTSSSRQGRLSAVEVDGVVLVSSTSADTDSLIDVPTNGNQTDTGAGGEVVGNYCTWNPSDVTTQVTASNGNLDLYSNNNNGGAGATINVSSGKWYWEVTVGDGSVITGIWDGSKSVTDFPGTIQKSYGYFDANGQLWNNNASSAYGDTFTAGDVIGTALDLDAGTLTFYKNGVSQGVAATGLTGSWKPALRPGNSGIPGTAYTNFGQRPFAHTAPTGYKALCSTNTNTSNGVKLTFATNKDLAGLSIGNKVKMGAAADVPYQPVSDSIVSVDGGISIPIREGSYNVSWNDATDLGTLSVSGTRNQDSTTCLFIDLNGITTEKIVLTRTGGNQFFIDGTNNASSGSKTNVVNNPGNQYTIDNSFGYRYAMIQATGNASIQYTYVLQNLNSVLTLSGATDLKYFRTGDVVQSSINGNYFSGGWVTANGNPTYLATNDNNKAQFASNDSWAFYEIDPLHTGSISVFVESSNSATGFGYFFSDEANLTRSELKDLWENSPVFLASSGKQSVSLIDYQGEKYIYVCGWLSNEYTPPTFNTQGDSVSFYFISNLVTPLSVIASINEPSIVAIDESVPSITVDGGAWSGTDGSQIGTNDPNFNQDQVWSDNFQSKNYNDVASPPQGNDKDIFDDNDTNFLVRAADSGTLIGRDENDYVYRLSNLSFTSNNTIVIRIGGNSSSRQTVWFNDDVSTLQLVTVASTSNSFTNLTLTNLPVRITEISIGGPNNQSSGSYACNLQEIKVDGKKLVDPGLGNTRPGDTEVTCLSPLKAPTNWTIEAIDTSANTPSISLSHATPDNSAQVWVANDNQDGTDFVVEPEGDVVIQQDSAYGKLQIVNNKAQVTGIQQDDPGFLPVPSKDYSIKFPSTFPTGNAPDDDLPRGACIEVTVLAKNTEGSDEETSNCLMPADVNPAGAAGPITATTPTTLTVASNSNLSSFSPSDNLVMVDENNDISDYTIVSDSISSVATTFPYLSLGEVTSSPFAASGYGPDSPGEYNAFNGTVNDPYNAAVSSGGSSTSNLYLTEPIPITNSSDGVYVGRDARQNANQVVIRTSNGDFNISNSNPGSIISGAGQPNQLSFVNMSDYIGHTITGFSVNNYDGYYAGVVGFVSGGQVVIRTKEMKRHTLTLSGDQDLKYFRVGDVVQDSTITVETNDGQFRSGFDASKGFDGIYTNKCGNNTVGTTPIGTVWNEVDFGSDGVNVATKINFLFVDSSHQQQVSINGGAYQALSNVSDPFISFTGKLYKVRFSTTSNGRYAYFSGIGYDDNLVVINNAPTSLVNPVVVTGGSVKIFAIDADATPNPNITVDGGSWTSNDVVTTGPVTGTGIFQSADLNANTMTLSVSNDRWIDNSNRLSKDFYVRDNVTVLNADNPKHVAMQEAIAQAFADFPDKVDARRSAIRSSFTRLVEGEALTAEEVATLEAIVDDAT